MELLVSHLVLSVVVGGAGLCVGWWLHSRLPDRGSFAGQNDAGLIRELLSSLHSLSLRMAADVNEHNTTVGAVDRELEQVRGHGAPQVAELVDRLIQANRGVQAKLTQTEGKLDELSEQMEHHASEARTDVLTGLSNRRAFQEHAARIQAARRETGHEFSLIMVDIDRFKQVNDAHGHPFGDEVLRGVSQLLLGQFRGRDLVTRYGGEEFAVLLPSTGVAEARRLAEHVRETIEKTRFEYTGKSLTLTVSLGVAEILGQETIPDLLKRADQAMYAAKHAGRNRVYWHDGTLPHPLRSPQNRLAEAETPGGGVSPVCEAYVESLVMRKVDVVIEGENESDEQVVTPGGPQSSELADETNTSSALTATEVDMDVLKNMGNKTMFCQNVHRRIAEYNRGGSSFSVVLLGVDNSEELVRRYGEPTSKLIQGVVAQAIRGRLREMDLLARYNDATFGMVLPDATLLNTICIGERLRKTVQETMVQFDGKALQFTVSLGIVEVEDGDEMATLVERARHELVQAQRGGGNRTGFSASALVAS